LGFAQAGFKIVWNNDINDRFVEMYKYAITNLCKIHKNYRLPYTISDIRSIKIINHTHIIKKIFPKKASSVFGVIGGPPCPDFSNGGKNKGFKGEQGCLSKIYVNQICRLKPSFFVFENVHGILRTKKHRQFLSMLEKKLQKKGYNIDVAVLNSLNFGLPQDRNRVFIIGVKSKLVKKYFGKRVPRDQREWFPWPEIKKYYNAKKNFNWPDKVLKNKTPRKPRNVPEELMVISALGGRVSPETLPNGDEYFKPHSKKFRTVHEGDTSRKSFKRLHRFRFSPTVCYGHNEVHLHPWKNRRLSVREAMRLQGIPDSYVLPKDISLTAKFTMIANGVPVPLAYNVALKLKSFIKKVVKGE
jgi:DNA (cytosine-5)-methyltransferase 1